MLKNEQGVNLQSLSNREKTIVIDALRSQYKLGDLLGYLGLAQADKYQNLKRLIKEIFNENHQCYGYRRIVARQSIVHINEQTPRNAAI